MRLNAPIRRKLYVALKGYFSVFAYLYICFGVILLYKTAILRGHGIDYAPFGLAAGKALLLAKFILIGHKLHIGENLGNGTLMRAILCKSVFFLLLLLGLSALEEAIRGFLHHQTIAGAFQLGSGRLGEAIAGSLLLMLILIPYLTYLELDSTLGEGKVLQLLRQRA
jgi:hypothetical protein